jgi:hypothetical protein
MGNKKMLLSVLAAVILMNASGWAAPVPAHALKAHKKAAACAPQATPTPVVVSEETISGTITAVSGLFDGSGGSSDGRERGALAQQYGMEVRAPDGSVSDVETVSSTLVFPAGARVKWGMKIKVVGHTVGCVFIARKITVVSYS